MAKIAELNEKQVNIIEIKEEKVKGLMEFLKKCDKQKNATKNPDEKNKIDRKMKEEIIAFFENEDLDIDENTKLNKIGNTFLVEDDIRASKRASNNNFKNLAWATIRTDDIGYDIWLTYWHEDYGVYVFELPEDDAFELEDFGITTITDYRNYGYSPYYCKATQHIERGKKGHRPPYRQADIILDLTDDCCREVFRCKYKNFKNYLRAKLDFNNNKLFIYPEKNPKTPEEYAEDRKKFMNGLNDGQREAATTNIKSSLIVAGAGCGKTHTLMGRVIHLYETGQITSPDDLLLVVFNRKNRKDFRKKLKKLGFVEFAKKSAHTFHSLGCSIIKATGTEVSTFEQDNDEPLDTLLRLFENYNYRPSNKLLYDKCEKISGKIKQIIEDKQWIDGLFEWSKNTLQDLDEPEKIRLMELYEKFIPNEEQRLLASQLDKLGTCLYTDKYQFDDDDEQKMRVLNYLILSGYKDEDIACVNNEYKYVQIKQSEYKKIYWEDYNCDRNFDKIAEEIDITRCLSEEEIEEILKKAVIRTSMNEFREVAKQFISLCKIYHDDNFDEFAKYTKERFPEQQILGRMPEDYIGGFYKLIPYVYEAYREFLGKELDFNDMINVAISKLDTDLKHPEYNNKFKYKYILVDEFQDVAYDTFKLIKALKDRSNASIMCVGDDWQAIYGWKGSDLIFFNQFQKCFDIPDSEYKEFTVTTTYRYGQKLASVSDKFIKETMNVKDKAIKAYKDNPMTRLIEWNRSSGTWRELIEKIRNEYKDQEISLKVLQRRKRDINGVSGKRAEDLVLDLQKYFKSRNDTTDVLTIHKSKGLEADVVIILDLWNGAFPSVKRTDPVIQGLHEKFNKTYDNSAEERRLFYVAMTRAKKACYFYHPSGAFWDEIKDDPNIEHE